MTNSSNRWQSISEDDIRAVSHLPGLRAQCKALGFGQHPSEGTRSGLAWRKWWLGILDEKELAVYKTRLVQKNDHSARVGGTILLLGLIAIGRKPQCEICGDGYDRENPNRVQLEVDHKKEWSLSFNNAADNLQILCSWHHKMEKTGSASDLYEFRDSLIAR